MALVDAYAAMAFAPDGVRLLPPGTELFDVWSGGLHQILRRAPQRLDVLAAYFNWLLVQQRPEDIEAMLSLARKADPTHPVLLWFSGVQLLGTRDARSAAQGLSLMRQALGAGLERFMPVDATTKAQLARAAGGG